MYRLTLLRLVRYSAEELKIVTKAFELTDKTVRQDGLIDEEELGLILRVMGVYLDDDAVEDLIMKHDRAGKNAISLDEWLEIMYPIVTVSGQRERFTGVFQNVLTIWVTIYVYIVLGALCMQALELEHERNGNEHWANLLESHSAGLNATAKSSVSTLIRHQVP